MYFLQMCSFVTGQKIADVYEQGFIEISHCM